MFENSVIRPMVGLPLAAVIVFGLFTFMYRMVETDFVPPEESPVRVLEAFVYEEPPTVPEPTSEPGFVDDAVQPPPPPPKYAVSATDIVLPAPTIEGTAPSTLPLNPLKGLKLDVVVISNKDVQPIRPPSVVYPDAMMRRGIEGDCNVYLDVDPRGRPYNVKAECTDPGFRKEAERAISKVEFAPRVHRGQAVVREGVVYPIEFRISR
ncbi:TonB family protein [Henriciella litoralis]|uniref:TonB family protein n=1 Tax=Henriciella litoralis TaxID=568102 RepID=UPI000A070900|nr:TonB family protein [Henriciella litoralis]